MKRGALLVSAGAVLLAGLLSWAGAAQALVLGNPAPDFKKGNFGVGVGLSDDRETVFADIGISDPGTLQLMVGNLDVTGGQNGTELGVGYRHKLDTSLKIDKFPVHLGILAAYRAATINTPIGSLKFNLIDVGFGGSITPVQNLNTYAAVIYERAKADTVLPILGKVSATETNLGLLAGVEYWITPKFVAGLELHPGLDDDGLAIFGEFKF